MVTVDKITLELAIILSKQKGKTAPVNTAVLVHTVQPLICGGDRLLIRMNEGEEGHNHSKTVLFRNVCFATILH